MEIGTSPEGDGAESDVAWQSAELSQWATHHWRTQLVLVRRNFCMNGKPGDHPITDLMIHHIAVFGEPLDTQLRQLGELMSYDRLCDWFQQHWSTPAEQLQPLVAAKLEELRRDACERGWENIP
jgi:hypothetical protein